jgi:hypothetical protein
MRDLTLSQDYTRFLIDIKKQIKFSQRQVISLSNTRRNK